jgi:hypothetical protein
MALYMKVRGSIPTAAIVFGPTLSFIFALFLTGNDRVLA